MDRKRRRCFSNLSAVIFALALALIALFGLALTSEAPRNAWAAETASATVSAEEADEAIAQSVSNAEASDQQSADQGLGIEQVTASDASEIALAESAASVGEAQVVQADSLSSDGTDSSVTGGQLGQPDVSTQEDLAADSAQATDELASSDASVLTDAESAESVEVAQADASLFAEPADSSGADAASLVSVSLATTASGTYSPSIFSDVSPDEWFVTERDYIGWIYDAGIMMGDSDAQGNFLGTFRPWDSVTRGEVAAILYRMANDDDSATTDLSRFASASRFWDVPGGQFYTAAVEWCYESGIVMGDTDANGNLLWSFRPNDPISRQELVTMLWRYCGKPSGSVDTNTWADFGSVAEYAKNATIWAASAGVMTGKKQADGSALLAPYDNAARAEIAKMICEMTQQDSTLPTDPGSGTTDSGSGTSTPDSGTSTPDSGTSTPDSGSGTSGTDQNTPDSGSSTSDDSGTSSGGSDSSSGDSGASSSDDSGTSSGGSDSSSGDSDSSSSSSDESEEAAIDPSLPVPTLVYSLRGNASSYPQYIDVDYDYEPIASGKADGFHVVAFKTDGSKITESEASTNWNNYGYVKVMFSGYYNRAIGRTDVVVKARSYKTENGTKTYGPWSDAVTFPYLNGSTPSKASAAYSYDLYYIDYQGNENVGTTLTGYKRVLYIKTDNPDPSTIAVTLADGKSINNETIIGNQCYYDDVDYLTPEDYDSPLHKVNGGYITWLKFSETGSHDCQLRELKSDGYVVAKSFTINVTDYEEAWNEWFEQISSAAGVTDSMSSIEKMRAISSYLNSAEAGFAYFTVDAATQARVTLASEPNTPYIISHRWDSASSPAALCKIAEKIGGFDEVHNCYGDYARGTSDWISMHDKARITYTDENGETHQEWFEVCPLTETGSVTVTKIDFSDTSKFYKIA